jgi:hypothetical protein
MDISHVVLRRISSTGKDFEAKAGVVFSRLILKILPSFDVSSLL